MMVLVMMMMMFGNAWYPRALFPKSETAAYEKRGEGELEWFVLGN
jgi:hypothetical protein